MPIDYTKRSQPGPAPQAGPPAGPPGGATSKVTLTKGSPSVSLTKRGSAGGVLRVNLTWNARAAAAPAGGLFSRRSEPLTVDLDLGCLYEFTDGSKGVVQALGGSFASRRSAGGTPVIQLDGDDRSGTSAGGENLSIDLSQVALIRRVLVFAYIYEGAPNWAAAEGVVTLLPAAGAPVEVRLDEPDPGAPMCAIALLENVQSDLQVRREVNYVRGSQRELDRAYGWGMTWAQGRK